ncbi:MAG: PASTA domain-containing protein, partial [Firmicutes bacterium]|nr:PASTA domain-containing protein [Bacillota bacterium]
SEPKGKKRKIRPLGMALIAIAILGLLSGVLYMVGGSLFGKDVAVPNIVGMDIKQADMELTKVSLVMNVIARQADDKVAKDAVISQDPAQGRKVKAGREINVVISDGAEQVKVPNITGVNQIEASTRLANKGLNLGTIQEVYDEKYAAGMIISQKPLADATVNSGTNVDVVVSKGQQPNKLAMPNLLGLSQTAATKKLQDNKLVLGEVKSAASNSYFADQVATQDTAAGVMVDEGTKVNITISTGPGPGSRTKQIQFDLPSGSQNYNVVITVTDAQGVREVYNAQRRAGDSISVSIKYYGTGTAQVMLNSKPFNTYSLP